MGLNDLDNLIESTAPPSRFRTTLHAVADTEPDAYAKEVHEGNRLNVPAQLLPKTKGDRRRLKMQLDPKLPELPRVAPKTAAFLEDENNARLAHDDYENLSGIEKWFREYGAKPAARVINKAGKFVDITAFPFAQAYDAIAGGTAARDALVRRVEQFEKQDVAAAADQKTGFLGRLVQSLEELAPIVATGPLAPYLITGTATVEKGLQNEKRGVTGSTNVALSALAGATGYAMTKIPMGGQYYGEGVKNTLKGYGHAMVQGAAGNVALGAAERTAEKGILYGAGYDRQSREVKPFNADDIANDIAMGVLFGGHTRFNQAKAERNAAAILAYVDLANKSALNKRSEGMTNVFKDFIKRAAEDGEIDHIGMPVEKFEEFYQSTGKPIEELLTDPDAYHEAKVSGGDVIIPIEDFTAHFAEHVTPDHIQDMRLRPGDDTLREAQEAAKNEDKDIEEFLASVGDDKGEETAKDSSQRVYDDVLGQLVGLHIPRDVAEKQAALWAIRQRTRAARMGADPWELYNEIPLEISRPLPDELRRRTVDTTLDPLLDRLRAGKIKGESQQFGPSLNEFLREKGVVDAGGELANLDIDRELKPFQRKMVRENGLQLDRARQAAIDAGYLPEDADMNALLDSIAADHRGEHVYSSERADLTDDALMLNQLKEHLDRAGIDLKKMSNEEIRKALSAQAELFQGGKQSVIRPAVKDGEEIKTGPDGARHNDIVPDAPEETRGFLTPDGDFIGREEAAKWLKENRPELYKELSPEAKKKLHSENLWDALDKSGLRDQKKGVSSLQEDEAKFYQGTTDKRGFIRLGEQKIEIGLLEKADLSTFLHETHHAFLEELRRDALRPDAPEQIKADWQTVKDQLGIASDDSIPTDAHEKWAEMGEGYYREGKAPSQDLMPLFQRFSAWIKQVYKKLTGSGVKLTDEVRGVFDRMLATDEEIARAQDMQNLRPLFADAKAAGMTEAEFAPYRKIAEKANEEAKNRLLKQLMDEMNREQKKWWRDEKDTMRETVTEEARNNPAYQAFQFFAKGESWDGVPVDNPMKLSREALVKMYGEDFVKKLPRSFHRLYAKEGGIHPDLAAEMFGFGSGDEMIRRLAEAPKMDQWISAETETRMREKYGDMLHDGSISEEALKAVHGDETGQLLRAELKAIRKMQGTVKEFTKGKEKEQRDQTRAERQQYKASIPPAKWFQAMASQVIDGKTLRDMKPGTYLRAEAKAGREAEEALAKQDFAAAADAKHRQLVNHYLYLEAAERQGTIEDTILPYMKKMEGKARQGEVGKAGGDYLEQIQGLLSRYQFSKIPYSALDQQRSLNEYLTKWKELYPEREIPIDSRITDETRQRNYREVPVSELEAVYDAVRAIEHAAKEITKVKKGAKEVFEDDAKEELKGRLAETHPEVNQITTDPQLMNKFQRGVRMAKKLNADMTRIEFLIERLDGGKQGPWHDFFWDGYLNAEIRKNELLDIVHEPLRKLVDEMPKEQAERLASREPIFIKSMGEAFSRQRLFSILMNMGNESNRDKLMRGGIMQGERNREFSQEAIDEIMTHFNKSDFDLAQGLWDTVGKLLPEAKALHKRWTGLDLPVVEPAKLSTPYGEYAGGYWPVKFDSRASEAGKKQDMDAAVRTVQDLFGFSSNRPKTSKGYTRERTDAAYPMLLDWKRIATRHINDVTKDLAYREWLDSANRLLKDPDMKRQLQVRGGEFSHDIMEKWLRGTVGADSWGVASGSAADEIYKAGYSHFTTAVLGLNIAGALADISAQQAGAFTRVAPKYMMGAYFDFFTNPKHLAEFVEEKSTWRRHIEKQVDQSIQNSIDYLAAHPTKYNNLMRMTLSMRVWMYKITGNIAWKAAYEEAIDQGHEEGASIKIADKVQRMTEHAGDIGSISAMERHPVWKKLLVYAGPMEVAYNAMMNNLIEIKNKKGLAPEAWGKFFTMWMAQSVLWAAVRGKKEDEESWAGFIGRHALLGPLEAFPVIRDLVPYAEKKLAGKRAMAPRGLAISAPFMASIDAAESVAKAIGGEGSTQKAIKDTNIAAGMVVGYPSMQLDITGQYLYDVLSGKYSPKHPWSPVTDALWRRKKGE